MYSHCRLFYDFHKHLLSALGGIFAGFIKGRRACIPPATCPCGGSYTLLCSATVGRLFCHCPGCGLWSACGGLLPLGCRDLRWLACPCTPSLLPTQLLLLLLLPLLLPQIPRAQWARLARRIGYVPMIIWGWCFSFMPKQVRRCCC